MHLKHTESAKTQRPKGESQSTKLRAWVVRTWKDPYDTLEPPAKSIKALLQMLVGLAVILLVGTNLLCTIIPCSTLTGDLNIYHSGPLTIVGDGRQCTR